MTPGERALWLAVFGASWHQSVGGPVGRVADAKRCELCVGQAERAIAALRELAGLADGELEARLAEVLR